MLRVLLIDDEPLALEGMKLLIDWQAEGFTVCGECKSAAEALELLPSAKPDLILTDIRMPGMGGLEFLSAARQAGFDGQYVIVSGYSDFQYAKKALQLGVAGYLLKPIEPADASAVLAHVRKKLIDRETESSRRQKAVHRAIGALLTEGGAPEDETLGAAGWMLATWGAPLAYPDLQKLSAQLPGDEATVHIVEDKEYLVLRLRPDGKPTDLSHIASFVEQLGRSMIVGGPVADPQALLALRKQLSDQLDGACRNALPGLVERLVRTVALRQADECRLLCRELDTFCSVCGTHAATHARRQLLSACSGLLNDRGEALEAFLQSQDADFETLCLLAIELLAPEQQSVSDRMESYALKHLNERITLEDVAAALTYNATYLGRIFTRERGIGFREWLTQKRMEESAVLLKTTDRSISDIS
ncbi:MAG: response regulator, partial [Firmicutes bacterium]|nr:response regulator [Bacillota bacterium]